MFVIMEGASGQSQVMIPVSEFMLFWNIEIKDSTSDAVKKGGGISFLDILGQQLKSEVKEDNKLTQSTQGNASFALSATQRTTDNKGERKEI